MPEWSREMATRENLGPTHEAGRSSDRSFGDVFAQVFAINAVWPVVLDGRSPRYWAVANALAFPSVALIRSKLLGPLNEVWRQFGVPLNEIVSPIVMRLLGKNPLKQKLILASESYWIERDPRGPAPEILRQQF